MNKEKKKEGSGKPRNQISFGLTDELRAQLEEERERRGGREAGVKLGTIAREHLAWALEEKRKKKK